MVEEGFHVDFEAGDWVLQVVVAEDIRVEDSDGADGSSAQDNFCASFGEVHGVVDFFQEVVVLVAEGGSDLGHE